ncbi:MAG TPA: hypothetical protein VL978_14705 [Puia sp.]|nr:hypothetical protein [Puia sp.]
MNSQLIRPLILGVFVFPLFVAAQQGGEGRQEPAAAGGQGAPGQVVMGQVGPAGLAIPGGGTGEAARYSDPGNNFFSNVPINELSPKAYRRFHRRFREVPTGEYWFKYPDGYQVSFLLDQHREFAYFDQGGMFRYSLRYYDGKEAPKEMEAFVKRRFPDYRIDVMTEVNDGQKTFYMLQIMNPDKIKVVTVADGRIDIINELNNRSANIGPAEAVR